MLVFRSIALGLLGACFLLLVTRPTQLRIEREVVPVVQPPPPPPATIIDVAHGVPPAELAQLVRLAPGEHVIAVDDQRVETDLDAGAMMASSYGRSYLDLTVGGVAGPRRVLVLLH
jgi:hypothetical protein